MTEKKYTWHKLADSLQELKLPASGIAEIELLNKKICITLYKDQLYACATKCPHAGGNLANGYIDALGNIVCPLHRYKFSLQRGRNTSGEGYYLKTFPVQMRPDGIFVGFEANNFFNWLK
jgi:3-phenylpropionate/trans-cinnamate dioxygenase ferredoxin subunit